MVYLGWLCAKMSVVVCTVLIFEILLRCVLWYMHSGWERPYLKYLFFV